MTEVLDDAPLAPAGSARRRGEFHELRVAAIDPLTDDAVAITFAVPEHLRADYDFAPGQHLTLRTTLDGVEVRRSYSICAPAGSGQLRVAVKRLDGGLFSAHAHGTLRVGDAIDVMTPIGRFTVQPRPDLARHHAFVAAGSGITPVLSLATTLLAQEPLSRVTLLYGNRTTRDVMFLEELADLKDRYPDRFTLVHVLSREPQEVELFSGRLDPDRLARILDALVPTEDVDNWFLCGPVDMVMGARDLLLSRGVEAARVHLELFHVEGETGRRSNGGAAGGGDVRDGDVRDGEVAATATFTLDGRTSTVDLRPGESVLDGALRVRSDAPFACKGGVCGTCRARLVDGEVAMDANWALEPDELEAGYVLACQSHPQTPSVAVDFDA
ncbi:MAG: 1,2-phenylacetyl-CoA epoxidase subunit PaaE [Actinomycetales bacterium]